MTQYEKIIALSNKDENKVVAIRSGEEKTMKMPIMSALDYIPFYESMEFTGATDIVIDVTNEVIYKF